MAGVQKTERITPSRALTGQRPAETVIRARQDTVAVSGQTPPAGWSEVKLPAGATLASLSLGDEGRVEEIQERNLGRPDWTVEVKNRPDGPVGWFLGLFGVKATRDEPRYGPGDALPEGATIWLPRELDPAAAAPPGFRRVALPEGRRTMSDLTGGDAAWEEAIAKANPDLAPGRIEQGGLYLNLPEAIPLEKGLPAPPDAAARADRGQAEKLARHVAHDALDRAVDVERGILAVKPGDTLAGLAKLVFNDATRWEELKLARDPDAGPGDDLAARGRAYVQLPRGYKAPDWGDVEPLNPEDPFLKSLAPAAARIQEKYGIPAAVILAQAAIESGWGDSKIGEYNIFGIKGSGSRGSLLVDTFEYSGGRKFATKAYFANFGSFDEALEEHAEILRKPQFASAMASKDDPKAFARALTGKYATDPNYGTTLIATMREQGMIDD